MQSNGTSRPGMPDTVATTLTLLMHRTVKAAFTPCPACGNATVEDFAQDADADGIVTCLKCNGEFDPKDFE